MPLNFPPAACYINCNEVLSKCTTTLRENAKTLHRTGAFTTRNDKRLSRFAKAFLCALNCERCESAEAYAWNDEPQPQLRVAFGLLNAKPRRSIPS